MLGTPKPGEGHYTGDALQRRGDRQDYAVLGRKESERFFKGKGL